MRKMGQLLIGSWIFLLCSQAPSLYVMGLNRVQTLLNLYSSHGNNYSNHFKFLWVHSFHCQRKPKSRERRKYRPCYTIGLVGIGSSVPRCLHSFTISEQWTPKNGYHWRKYINCYIVGCLVQYHLHWVFYNQEPPKQGDYYVTRPVVFPPIWLL